MSSPKSINNNNNNQNDDDAVNDQDDRFLTTMQIQQDDLSLRFWCPQDEDNDNPRRLLSHPHFIQKITRYVRILPGDYIRPLELSQINRGFDETFWHYSTLHTSFWNRIFRWYPPLTVVKNMQTCLQLLEKEVEAEGRNFGDECFQIAQARKTWEENKNNNTEGVNVAAATPPPPPVYSGWGVPQPPATSAGGWGVAPPAPATNGWGAPTGAPLPAGAATPFFAPPAPCHRCAYCLLKYLKDSVAPGFAVTADHSYNIRTLVASHVVAANANTTVQQHQQQQLQQQQPAFSAFPPSSATATTPTTTTTTTTTTIQDPDSSLYFLAKMKKFFTMSLDDSFYRWIQRSTSDAQFGKGPSSLYHLSFKTHILPLITGKLLMPNEDDKNNTNNKTENPTNLAVDQENYRKQLRQTLLIGRLIMDGLVQQPALMQRLFSANTERISGYLQPEKNLTPSIDILIHALLIDYIHYECDQQEKREEAQLQQNLHLRREDTSATKTKNHDDKNNNNLIANNNDEELSKIFSIAHKTNEEVFTTLFDSFFKASVLMRTANRSSNAQDIGRLNVLSPIFACSASISPVLEAILGGNVWCLEIMLDRIIYWTRTRKYLQETGHQGLSDEEIRQAKSKILRTNVQIKNQSSCFRYNLIITTDDRAVEGSADWRGGQQQQHWGASHRTSVESQVERDIANFIIMNVAPTNVLEIAAHCGNIEMFSHLWEQYYKEHYLPLGSENSDNNNNNTNTNSSKTENNPGAATATATSPTPNLSLLGRYELVDLSLIQLPVLDAFPIVFDHLTLPATLKNKNKKEKKIGEAKPNVDQQQQEQQQQTSSWGAASATTATAATTTTATTTATPIIRTSTTIPEEDREHLELLHQRRLRIFALKLKNLIGKWNPEFFAKQKQQYDNAVAAMEAEKEKKAKEAEKEKQRIEELKQSGLDANCQPLNNNNNNDTNNNFDNNNTGAVAAPAAPGWQIASSAPVSFAPLTNANSIINSPPTFGNFSQLPTLSAVTSASSSSSAPSPPPLIIENEFSGRTSFLEKHITWSLRMSLAAITTFYSSIDITTAPLYNTEHLLKVAFDYLETFFDIVPVEMIQKILDDALCAEARRLAANNKAGAAPVHHPSLNQRFVDYSSSTLLLLRLLIKPIDTKNQQSTYPEKIFSLVHEKLFASDSSKTWLCNVVEQVDRFPTHSPIWMLVDLFDRTNTSSTAENLLNAFKFLLEIGGTNLFAKKPANRVFFDPNQLFLADPRCRRYSVRKPGANLGAINDHVATLTHHFLNANWLWRTSEASKQFSVYSVTGDSSSVTLLHRICMNLSRVFYIESEQTPMHEGFRGEQIVEEEASKYGFRRQLRVGAVRALLRRIELHDARGIDAAREFIGSRTESNLLTAADVATAFAFPQAITIFEEEFGVVSEK